MLQIAMNIEVGQQSVCDASTFNVEVASHPIRLSVFAIRWLMPLQIAMNIVVGQQGARQCAPTG
jgi:hypothetical protein